MPGSPDVPQPLPPTEGGKPTTPGQPGFINEPLTGVYKTRDLGGKEPVRQVTPDERAALDQGGLTYSDAEFAQILARRAEQAKQTLTTGDQPTGFLNERPASGSYKVREFGDNWPANEDKLNQEVKAWSEGQELGGEQELLSVAESYSRLSGEQQEIFKALLRATDKKKK